MNSTPRSIRSDYLSGATPLRPFYAHPIAAPDFGAVIARKAADPIDRATLQAVIRDQYGDLPLPPALARNLEALGQPHTYTVTTGHQLVLFGGPLFTTYKILSTIALAERISREQAGVQVVPVFWIHTEDHDFEEINHFFTAFNRRHTYGGRFVTQVGTHVLEPEIEAVSPETLDAALRAAYAPGRSLAEAFRRFIHALFGAYGLLILDASDPRLKARFGEVVRAELEAPVTEQAVQATSAALTAAGYPQQISPREINLFYLDDKGRDRLRRQGDGFAVVGRDLRFTHEALLQELEAHPERFSPNVSLRPLYQEMILPNLAYFGGWGEIAYWLQLKGVFDHFGVAFPLVLPRFSATLFRPAQAQAWTGMGFDLAGVQQPLHDLYRAYLPQVWDDAPFRALEADLMAQLSRLESYIETELSPTLARSAKALAVKNARYLATLHKKAERVVRHRQPAAFRQIEAIKQAVQPDGTVQERVLSLAAFAPDYAPEALIAELYPQIDPLDFTHRYIALSR